VTDTRRYRIEVSAEGVEFLSNAILAAPVDLANPAHVEVATAVSHALGQAIEYARRPVCSVHHSKGCWCP
jgi:hypothetical protein